MLNTSLSNLAPGIYEVGEISKTLKSVSRENVTIDVTSTDFTIKSVMALLSKKMSCHIMKKNIHSVFGFKKTESTVRTFTSERVFNVSTMMKFL